MIYGKKTSKSKPSEECAAWRLNILGEKFKNLHHELSENGRRKVRLYARRQQLKVSHHVHPRVLSSNHLKKHSHLKCMGKPRYYLALKLH